MMLLLFLVQFVAVPQDSLAYYFYRSDCHSRMDPGASIEVVNENGQTLSIVYHNFSRTGLKRKSSLSSSQIQFGTNAVYYRGRLYRCVIR